MAPKPIHEVASFDKLAVDGESRCVAGEPHGRAASLTGADPLDLERLAEFRQLEEGEPEDGRGTLVNQIISSFLEAAPHRFAGVAQAVTARDARLLQELAHSFKGSSSNIGAMKVAAACDELERLGRTGALHESGGATAAEAAMATLDFELDRAIKALEGERDSS